MARITRRQMPVMVGNAHDDYAMAEVNIVEEPERTSIQLTLNGANARRYTEFITMNAPIAISFVAIPVTNPHESKEKN